MRDKNRPSSVHYIHYLSTKVQERIAGIFVLSAVVVIAGLVLIQSRSSHFFDNRIIYNAYLTNAQGITTETLINVSGIEVGRVMAIDITPENKIHVTFFVYENFQRLIRTDSTGELNKLSVIGNTVIIIKPGSHQLPILAADAAIPIEEPVTIEDLIAELTPVITSLKDTVQNVSAIVAAVEPDKLKSATLDLSLFMSNLKEISEQLTQGRGLLGSILYDEQLAQGVSNTIADTGQIIKNTDRIVKDSEKSVQLVENILRETELRVKELKAVIQPAADLANKSSQVITDLNPSVQIVNSEIQQLPAMINDMQTLLDSTNRTLQAAQKVWPISTVIAPANNETVVKDQPLDD